MAVPKKRTSRSRRGMRRAHTARETPAMAIDRQTKSVHRPHHVDLKTGFYRGKQILFKEDEGGAEAQSPQD